MDDEVRRSPLDARAGDLALIGAREVRFLQQLSVRTRTPEAFGLPTDPNTWAALDGSLYREALWLGPDEWLLVAGAPNGALGHWRWPHEDPLAERIAPDGSIVDVSANRAVIELVRDDARSLLEQGCSIDLHPRSWRPGMCAQTLLAHVPVILQERAVTRIYVRPSFANWLLDWLVAVA